MINQLILYTNDNHHIIPSYFDDDSGDENIFLDVFSGEPEVCRPILPVDVR